MRRWQSTLLRAPTGMGRRSSMAARKTSSRGGFAVGGAKVASPARDTPPPRRAHTEAEQEDSASRGASKAAAVPAAGRRGKVADQASNKSGEARPSMAVADAARRSLPPVPLLRRSDEVWMKRRYTVGPHVHEAPAVAAATTCSWIRFQRHPRPRPSTTRARRHPPPPTGHGGAAELRRVPPLPGRA
jgi:hypothetical protein